MARTVGNVIGQWAFLIGVIIAIILGAIGSLNGVWVTILVIIGIIIGLLNISVDEVMPFLWSGTVLVIVSYFGASAVDVIPAFARILQSLLIIFVPATVIVALRNVFGLARR